jgi:hypothetical protein
MLTSRAALASGHAFVIAVHIGADFAHLRDPIVVIHGDGAEIRYRLS